MRDGVSPGEEDDWPASELMKGDIFVKWYDAIEWCLSHDGNECSANGKQNHCDVEV